MGPRYCIGIDLGTTNSVVAYASLDGTDAASTPQLKRLPIPQWISAGQIESRDSLPSFLYLPREGERSSLMAPFVSDPQHGICGYHARAQAAENPQRVVVAAKSWLSHASIGRTEAVLPWQSPAEIPKLSAFECTRRYLTHLIAAWQAAFPDDPIVDQQVVLTVPASFDPAARQLTRQAAIEAGLPDEFVLLEEPQAAVYHWLAVHPQDWRRQLGAGDVMLVIDVGGGTTDLTLVAVEESEGELQLQRLAVGNHLLLGGDNMDLALAHQVAIQLAEQGHDLDPWQSVSLWHACRDAKEQLLSADGAEQQTVSVLGRGSSLIGGTISTALTRRLTEQSIVDGFFPHCDASARPERRPASGFQDIGLPYEADPAITKQVAAFLADHRSTVTHLLFNGGVFRSDVLRLRMQDAVNRWCETAPTVLGQRQELDAAVALGAAYYGWSKHVGGIRIRGGTARSYYIGIETAGLAIPGAPRPLRALCVAPHGMEEGSEAEVPGKEIGLIVGTPARFRFFASSNRGSDTVGTQLDRWTPDELVESEPLELTLRRDSAESSTDEASTESLTRASATEPFVPVRFVSRVTELGMFELWCHSTRSDERWKMEFNVREHG